MTDSSKWQWMMDYCRKTGMSPAQQWAWDKAEKEYEKEHSMVTEFCGVNSLNKLKPSFFVAKGIPLCSIWGKSEVEFLAFEYVKTLAETGDEWRELDFCDINDARSWEKIFFDAVKERCSTLEGVLTIKGYWRVSQDTYA